MDNAILSYIESPRHDGSSYSFAIKRMEDYWDINRNQPEKPHRHGFYTVMLVMEANGSHVIDFNSYPMSGRQVFFVSPGQVHQVIEREQSKGYVIAFDTAFLSKSNIPVTFIEDLKLFRCHGDSPPLSLNPAEEERLKTICEEMCRIFSMDIKYKDQALGSLLQLFLIQTNNLCQLGIEDIDALDNHGRLLREFRQLIDHRFSQWHNTSPYAEKLAISPDHLNRVVKQLTGSTAKDMIQQRIATEAKRQLYFSESTAKEIAYNLGFSEPAHFSSFFKNNTGQSPSEFRLQRDKAA